MKLLTYLILFSSLAFAGCSSNGQPEIEKVEATFISREGAKVYFSYPKIESGVADSVKQKLNAWLKNIADLREKKVANGDFSKADADILYKYSVLLLNDSILSIENKKTYKSTTGKRIPNSYRSIVVDHRDANVYISPEMLFPELNRSALIPHIEKSMENYERQPNMRAYEDGAGHLISFAVKKDSLIVYPGNEGEFFSYDRLPISFEELGIEWQ